MPPSVCIRARLPTWLGVLLAFQLVAPAQAAAAERPMVVVAFDRNIYEARPAQYRQSGLRAQLAEALEPSRDVDTSSNSDMTTVTIVVRNPTQHADLIDAARRLLAKRPQVMGQIDTTQAFLISHVGGSSQSGSGRRAATLIAELRDAPYINSKVSERGLEGIVTDPARHPDFQKWLEQRASESLDLDLTWTPAAVIQLSLPDNQIAKPGERGGLDDFWNLSAPLVEMIDLDGGLAFRAIESEFSAERGERIRKALAGRSDLSIETRPDQSMVIRFLSPPPRASLPDEARLLRAVRARLAGEGLRPLKIEPLDAKRARIKFATDSEARAFRTALENPYGFSVRVVDEPMDTFGPSESATAPSPGDLRLPLREGGFLWLKPEAVIAGDMVQDAVPYFDRFQKSWSIHYELTAEGQANFASATDVNIRRRLAFVLDGVVIEAPEIIGMIRGGSGELPCECSEATNSARAKSLLRYKDDLPLRLVAE